MREIKFRAWDKINRLMLDCVEISFYKKYVVLVYDNGEGGELQLMKWEDVELMQYTGLKDKNGDEIYEGDLLKNNEPHESIKVKWSNLKGAWTTGYLGLIADLQAGFVDGGDGETYNDREIIGNIYENPELLK